MGRTFAGIGDSQPEVCRRVFFEANKFISVRPGEGGVVGECRLLAPLDLDNGGVRRVDLLTGGGEVEREDIALGPGEVGQANLYLPGHLLARLDLTEEEFLFSHQGVIRLADSFQAVDR